MRERLHVMKVKKISFRDGMLSKEYVQLLGLESE